MLILSSYAKVTVLTSSKVNIKLGTMLIYANFMVHNLSLIFPLNLDGMRSLLILFLAFYF